MTSQQGRHEHTVSTDQAMQLMRHRDGVQFRIFGIIFDFAARVDVILPWIWQSNIYYQTQTVYAGTPRPAIDEAWDELISRMEMPSPPKDLTGG